MANGHKAKESIAVPVAVILLIWTTLGLSGCDSLVSKNYPTLKQTQLHVSCSMTSYRNAASGRRLTTAEKERVNAAYARYQAAFQEAFEAAQREYDAPTPQNVKALAYDLTCALAATHH